MRQAQLEECVRREGPARARAAPRKHSNTHTTSTKQSMQELVMPDERARHCSVLAACAPASAAIVAPKSHRTPRGLTDTARLCPCHPIVKQLAKRPAASCGGGFRPRSGPQRQTVGGAPPHCALRRSPRPLAPLRGQHVSLQVQKCACVVLVQDHGNVCWSVHCGRVGAYSCMLALACARVLRRLCRMSLPTPETARPFPSCRTTGPRREREGTRHAVHCSRKFFCTRTT